MKRTLYLTLLPVFILALILRFLFFPSNVYFGYDQARDSYASLEILKGHLKLIGPPSSVDDRIFHGPLIYYIYVPIYLLFHLSPEGLAFVFRIINALGIFLVFAISANLFNKKVGFISAFLFAVSYEQTQYSLFLSHPSLAVISVLIYYLGLSLAIFKNNKKGLILIALGLGLSIQFHYVNLFLICGLIAYVIFFYKNFLNSRLLILSFLVFLLTTSTFLISEVKFNFRTSQALSETFTKILTPSVNNEVKNSVDIMFIIKRFIHDNFISQEQGVDLFSEIFGITFLFLLIRKALRPKLLFLMIWLMSGLLSYLITKNSSYYLGPGASLSLIIFVSYLIFLILKRSIILGIILILIIAFNNLGLIFNLNQKGPNSDIVIQPQMLTRDEKVVLDYCYKMSQLKPFSVNALSIPLYINTTWSFLFEWYGLQK